MFATGMVCGYNEDNYSLSRLLGGPLRAGNQNRRYTAERALSRPREPDPARTGVGKRMERK